MGGEPYWYFVKYKPDLDAALQELREREFLAGRYNPVTPFLRFPVDPTVPGPARVTIRLTRRRKKRPKMARDRSSIFRQWPKSPIFAWRPRWMRKCSNRCMARPHPTRRMIEENMDFLDEVDRGHAVYALAYKDGKPDEILFAGYSFDYERVNLRQVGTCNCYPP